jgi:hypothetical protein
MKVVTPLNSLRYDELDKKDGVGCNVVLMRIKRKSLQIAGGEPQETK